MSLHISTLISEEQKLQDGVTYELRNTPDSIKIHILHVDPTQVRIRPISAACESLDQAGPSIASIRGISSILKINNEWLKLPYTPKEAYAWSELNPQLLTDRILAEGHVRIGEALIRFSKLNTARNDPDAVLYTPHFDKSIRTTPSGKELIINQSKLVHIAEEVTDTTIPPNGFVLSLGPTNPYINITYPMDIDCAYRIYVTPLIDSTQSSRQIWDNAQHILEGSVLLIKSGKLMSLPEEQYSRAAIGTLGNGLWAFVIVDNTPSLESHDMTITELQQFMLSLGCTDALTIDNGLETTLTIQNKAVNTSLRSHPEEINDISNGIVILPK